jgi:hypothetical protein
MAATYNRELFLDLDILTDLLTNADVVRSPLRNVAEVTSLVRQLADHQLSDLAAREVYEKRNYENPGLRRTEIEGKSIEDAADLLYARLAVIREQSAAFVDGDWKRAFCEEAKQKREELREQWDLRWLELCDGKRLFKDLQQNASLKTSSDKFKREVIREMRLKQSDAWLTMNGLIQNAMGEGR